MKSVPASTQNEIKEIEHSMISLPKKPLTFYQKVKTPQK